MATVSLERFLAPITKSLNRSVPPKAVKSIDHATGPERELFANMSFPESVQVFIEQAQALGTFVVEAKPEEVGSTIASMIEKYGAKKLVLADDPRADGYGIPAALEDAGVETIRWNGEDATASLEAAESAEVGLTFARFAIAETGSIVQESDSKSGRSIALLPLAHIGIVRKSDIKRRMIDVMDEYSAQVDEDRPLPSNITVISGPSVTADIELVRVVGVHGAVHTGIVIVDE